VDENNEPINIPVAVHHDEHEFPWGNSLDIGDANADYGNDYTTTNTVEASVDEEVLQSKK